MKQKITRHRAVWAAMAGIIMTGVFAGPQAAFADGDKGKGKDGKVPIVIKKPIVTQDPQDPPKKK